MVAASLVAQVPGLLLVFRESQPLFASVVWPESHVAAAHSARSVANGRGLSRRRGGSRTENRGTVRMAGGDG